MLKKFFTQRLVTPAAALLLVLAAIGGTVGAHALAGAWTPAPSPEAAYALAVRDSMTIEDGEMLPVVQIAEGSGMATLNGDGEVLLITWHKYPDSYVAGQDVTLQYGEVWAFTDREIVDWYGKNRNGVSDWELRFEQLLGLPPEKDYTHFTALWAPAESVKRPAYTFDAALPVTDLRFGDGADEDFVAWFDANIVSSYFDGAYPWTRLGYTYDWKEDGKEYGLSEFIIEKDAVARVEFTRTTGEFLQWLEGQ